MTSRDELKSTIAYFPLLLSLGPRALLRLLASTAFSINHFYILGKSLSAPLGCSPGRKPEFTLSLLDEEGLAWLKRSLPSLAPEERREVLSRIRFYESGFTHCYVIQSGDGLAYLQWLIYPFENGIIKQRYAHKFYQLTDKQVMIENAFTFPSYRGRGYLLFGTLQLMEMARSQGYSSAICYIRKDRIASLNEFTRIGFKIIKMISEYKLIGRVCRSL